jgi:hypothetical protein
LRLCAFARVKNKKEIARKAGKAHRPPEVKPSAPQFLCGSAPVRRGGQVFAREKKSILLAKPPRPQEVKPSGPQFLCMFAREKRKKE